MSQLLLICFAAASSSTSTPRRAGQGLDALPDVQHTSRLAASAYALSASVSAGLTAAFASSAAETTASKLDGTWQPRAS